MTAIPVASLAPVSPESIRSTGFSRWTDTLARPPRRLPDDTEETLAYVSDALGYPVFKEWTPRTLVRRYGSPEMAKQGSPVVFQLLLHHDRVVEYFSRGQTVIAPSADAPALGAVLNGLLRMLPRFRQIDASEVKPTDTKRTRASGTAAVSVEPISAGPWLDRVGRYFNADPSSNMLGVTDDRAAVRAFLRERTNRSTHTRRAYVQEIRRLAAWAQAAGPGPLSDLSRESLVAYRDALPQIRSLAHADAGPLSARSVTLAIAVVKSLFSYWANTGYLRVNAASALGTLPRSHRSLRPERFLPAEALAAVDEWLTALVSQPCSRATLRRACIVGLYRYAGVRVAELAATGDGSLPHIVVQADDWTLEVSGKGGRQRLVPLPARCVILLQRYRQARGLPEMPQSFENIPLIEGKRGGALGASGLYREVKAALAQIAKASPDCDYGSIAALNLASPHWLRHAYARAMVVDHGAPLPVAQNLLGHANVATTAGYATPDLSEARRFVTRTFDAPEYTKSSAESD